MKGWISDFSYENLRLEQHSSVYFQLRSGSLWLPLDRLVLSVLCHLLKVSNK